MATTLGCAVLALASGCGDTPRAGDGGAARPAPTSTSSPGPTATPSASEPFVPGSPTNQVRPATAGERASWPPCRQVWQPRGQLPARYRGCVAGGEAVVADLIECSFGTPMTTYGDRYYGVVGNVVNDADESLSTSRRYARAHALCTG